jgi:predicted ATP-dependent serine protease
VPGSVSQLRECTLRLVRFAKERNVSVFLVGHVTREGTLSGPRVLEHMVDTVLYFEGEAGSCLRIVRAVKNRFGAVNEIGVFAMTEKGLREVRSPSAVLLPRHEVDAPGSIVTVTREGTRPLLVEVQALIDKAYVANVRRVGVRLEQNRLSMLLAMMHRHAGISTHDQDVLSTWSVGCGSPRPLPICPRCWRWFRAYAAGLWRGIWCLSGKWAYPARCAPSSVLWSDLRRWPSTDLSRGSFPRRMRQRPVLPA